MIYQICITENGKYGAYDVDNGALACTAATLEDLTKQIDQILIKEKRGEYGTQTQRIKKI